MLISALFPLRINYMVILSLVLLTPRFYHVVYSLVIRVINILCLGIYIDTDISPSSAEGF